MDVIGDVIVNGRRVAPGAATISVLDLGFQRGYGCFEALRAYGGRPFRMRQHLDRLERSAAALLLPAPDRSVLEGAVVDRAGDGGDCIVRVYVSAGTDARELGSGATTVVLAEAMPEVPDAVRLEPTQAPWHSDGVDWELTGAKTLSYAPNFNAYMTAKRHGYDDALLIGRSGFVLEGPTYSVGWVRRGIIETPCMELGILASVTRSAVIDVAGRLGLDLVEGEYDLPHVLGADEVFVMSTVKEVTPVSTIGTHGFEPGPVTAKLAAGFHELVSAELAAE